MQALLDIQAVKFTPNEPKTFKSGILSPIYIDNRAIPYHPQAWHKVIAGFQAIAKTLDFDIIAGIAVAGIPHSAALAYVMNKPSVFVRKETKAHGLKNRIEGGDVSGKRVLLIEDLITTGGSSLAGVAELRRAGGIVTDCMAIVSYGFQQAVDAFQQAAVKLHTLTNFDQILQIGLQTGYFQPTDVKIIRAWMSNPYEWGRA
ncbi:MAG: orotate phosphoribosyltransferase [Phototrophicales bacterium]